MKKKNLIFASAIPVTLLIFQSIAFSETRTCKYSGLWTQKGLDSSQKFTWNVKWSRQSSKKDEWQLIGEYNDADGIAFIKGNCTEENCYLSQSYISGEYKGYTYWLWGKYKNQTTSKQGESISMIKGTWGTSEENMKDGGEWEAKANCQDYE